MSEKPEKKSAAFQSDAFQAESAAPKSPRRLCAVAWVRGTIFGLVPFLARVPRQVLAGIGALLILFGTVYEWRKPPAPINSPSPRLLGWIWWANPRQLNPERTLPAFDHANIQSVEVVPKSSRVWIAGDAGLLAYSDDGTNWTTFHYDPVTGTMVKDVPVAVATLSPLVTWHVEAAQSQAQQQTNANPQASKENIFVTIHGTVTDEQGAAIPGADVTVTNLGTSLTSAVQSGSDGTYNFPYLPPGTYT